MPYLTDRDDRKERRRKQAHSVRGNEHVVRGNDGTFSRKNDRSRISNADGLMGNRRTGSMKHTSSEKAAVKRMSGGKGSSIPPLSEEKRRALVKDAKQHLRASKKVYEELAE